MALQAAAWGGSREQPSRPPGCMEAAGPAANPTSGDVPSAHCGMGGRCIQNVCGLCLVTKSSLWLKLTTKFVSLELKSLLF